MINNNRKTIVIRPEDVPELPELRVSGREPSVGWPEGWRPFGSEW